MSRRRSSLKRQRQDKKRRLRNLKVKRELKKTLKKFQTLLSTKNIDESPTFDKVRDEAKKLMSKIFSQLDKAAKKRIIHPRLANRKKSRLARWLTKVA